MGFTILTAAALGFLGPGTAAAHARVGPDHRRVARVPARRVVVRGGAGSGHLPHGHGLQPARRRPARRARPAAARAAGPRAMAELLSVRGLSVDFVTDGGVAQVLDGISLDIGPGEVVGPGRRERLRQDHAGPRHPRHPARRARANPRRRGTLQGRRSPARGPRGGERARARPGDHVHSARSLHLVQSGLPGRDADHGSDEVEVAAVRRRRRGAARRCRATRASATAPIGTPCSRPCARSRSPSRPGR